MANKKNWLGMLIAMLVFGMFVVSCLSGPEPNYYNLGNVSEENYALIQVSHLGNNTGDYPIRGFVNIDGQGDFRQWRTNRVPFGGEGKAIVRVIPSNHTFTLNFVYENKDIPVNITYDCKAGMGYSFSITAKNISGGLLLNPIEAEVIIFESPIDQNGNFGSFSSNMRVAARHKETFHQEALKLR